MGGQTCQKYLCNVLYFSNVAEMYKMGGNGNKEKLINL